jgi:hypothetical protein
MHSSAFESPTVPAFSLNWSSSVSCLHLLGGCVASRHLLLFIIHLCPEMTDY